VFATRHDPELDEAEGTQHRRQQYEGKAEQRKRIHRDLIIHIPQGRCRASQSIVPNCEANTGRLS